MAWRRLVTAVTALSALSGAACRGGAPAANEPFAGARMGFLFVGARDDLGYNQAAWKGSEAVAKAFPDYEVLRVENVPETDRAAEVMEDLIRRGARILFPTSFGHLPFAAEVARRHPEVIVVHQGGVEPQPRLDNLGTYWGTVYEPVYQAGIVAGAMTRSGKLGFVAAFPIPATFNNVNAFTLGARSVNPRVTTTVVFTGDWCDPPKQAALAQQLLAAGADVLTQHQDCTRTMLEVAEAAGAYSVGYHADGSEVAPRGWLTGAVWVWDELFIDIVATILDGRFEESPYNRDYRGGLRTGDNPFLLTELGPQVPPSVADLVAAAEARFRSSRTPFDGPLRDRDGRLRVAAGAVPTQTEIDEMRYFVEGVIGEVPPTTDRGG